MNDAATSMAKHGMHHSILLTEMGLVRLALLDIVYLHAVVAFRSKQQTTLIIKVDGKDGVWRREWFSWAWSRGITMEMLDERVNVNVNL